MFLPRRLLLGALLCTVAPIFAAPTSSTAQKYDFADELLEARWSWRGTATLPVGGEIDVALGWKDAANSTVVRVHRDTKAISVRVQGIKNGAVTVLGSGQAAPFGVGELGLQKVGNRLRVLWNGQTIAIATVVLNGAQFGTLNKSGASLDSDSPQPTETVVFRDDFMRAEGPEDQEIPGEWKIAGVWKTSGSLGPKSDAALNPNPFVFRAQSLSSAARAGKWWWSDYSVSASIRATRTDAKAPLVAGVEAFSDGQSGGVRGEIDFGRGVASIKDGGKVLATSAPFDTQPGQWHRVRLEPGPGTARLYVDGILRVSAPSKRAQGSVVLRAGTGNANFVDFDDVRVGDLQNGHEWGEGALPERFIKDRLMRNWASNASAWKRDSKGVWWHTGDFFGAAQLKLDLPSLRAGNGFELIFAADPKNERSGLHTIIARPADKNELTMSVLGASKTQVLPLPKGPMPLAVGFAPQSALSGKLSVDLAGKLVGEPLNGIPLAARGTKLGIRPLQNGKPLPPPALQKLEISSATYLRDGRTMIGINYTPVTPDLARKLGLPDGTGAAVDNVDDDSPAKLAGVREGDVIRSVEGNRVTDVDSMRTVVGGVKPGTALKLEILRPDADSSGLDWSRVETATPNVVDYSFTAAPVDWQPARGTWDIAERWTCSPQWSFFAGQNDQAPILWSRFATKGDWTLEAYLASPMDLARGERSPTDLNITVGGDGVDLASGYSFLFGGKSRSVNQIRRGDKVAWEKPFIMPPGVGETHQDWFYVRLERRQTTQGVRFRYSVNGRELANYLDPKPLADGGHIGFWTLNGGLSIARVRLWNAGMQAPQPVKPLPGVGGGQSTFTNILGNWTPRGQGSDTSAIVTPASLPLGQPKTIAQTLHVINPRSGGDWTTFVTRKLFSTKQFPALEWDYKLGEGVKVNLYALVDDTWREIVFSGGSSADEDGDIKELGEVSTTAVSGGWRRASFDLAAALKRKGLGSGVQALAFAAPDEDYLRAGLGGNHRGASYWIKDFRAGK